MTDGLSRRSFLQRSATAGAGVVLLGASEILLTAPNAGAAPAGPGYGPLVPDPAGRLALPAGFSYTVVTEAGVTRLESGELTPNTHDGAGAFVGPADGTVLVYNHEIRAPFATAPLPVPHIDGFVYDTAAAGGCTVVEADRNGKAQREYVGIAGTATNCAGGITPWDTWLTCEETEERAGGANRYTMDHGFVFEVDPYDREANRDPKPLKFLGRYAGEAAVVDPKRGDIFVTEDASNPNGLLYRWEAPRGFKPKKGCLRPLADDAGVLGAMKCADGAGAHIDDLSRATELGTTYSVTWVPVPDRGAATVSTRRQFAAGQITRARKLEGMWWGDGGTYVVCSFSRGESPGPAHDGMVWFYDPKLGTLTLKLRFGVNPAAATSTDVDGPFDGPDNITVSPWGGVLLAEDGDGVSHIVGATDDGRAYAFARNQLNESEFAGPVFSKDKRILYVSIQSPGIMYAITGPWRKQR